MKKLIFSLFTIISISVAAQDGTVKDLQKDAGKMLLTQVLKPGEKEESMVSIFLKVPYQTGPQVVMIFHYR